MRDDFHGMPPHEPIQWYIARDGQQYGPLSDAELKKFNELGHLRSTDLVWRKDYSAWRPAGQVFVIRPTASS